MSNVTRRRAREILLQFFYQIDINSYQEYVDDYLRFFDDFLKTTEDIDESKINKNIRSFMELVLQKLMANYKDIDEIISNYTDNWDFSRIAAVDRCILRMAVCEMKYIEDIPAIVSINEAVDISKKYSSYDSGKFINGVLDRIRKSKKY